MQRWLRIGFGTFIALLVIGVPVGYWHYFQSNFRNFRVVKDGVLYRSGQLSLGALKQLVHDHGIKTVITLRDAMWAGEAPPDLREERYCNDQEILYTRIHPRSWGMPEGLGAAVPAEEGVQDFLDVMDNPENYPVLIHCLAGMHRTGAFCAIYRMEYDHWSNPKALEEMRTCGYLTIDSDLDILEYLETYCPRWQTRAPRTTDSDSVGLKAATVER